MDQIKVKKLKPNAIVPRRTTAGASGFDLCACIDEGNLVLGRAPQLVGTGIAIEFSEGLDVQVRPRSGLSLKGVGVTLGTIDCDYRGEIMVTMYLFGDQSSFTVNHADRIGQLVITKLADVELQMVEELTTTERGDGGHGSTGLR